MSDYPPPTVPPATPPPPGGGSYTPPPPPPYGGGGPAAPGPGGPVSSDRQLMIALAYLGPLALIPYLTKKDDPDAEVRWHAKNGLALFILDIVLWVLFFILGWVISAMGATIGCLGGGLLTALQCILWVGLFALHVYCLIKAINGQRVRIPVMTDFAEKSL